MSVLLMVIAASSVSFQVEKKAKWVFIRKLINKDSHI